MVGGVDGSLSGSSRGDERMVYSLVLEFSPEADAAITQTHGYQAYALLLQMIERTAPDLSCHLHDLPAAKPFTVSPLSGHFERREGLVVLRQDQPYRMRLTLLADDVFARTLDALARLPNNQPLRLEAAALKLSRVMTVPGAVEGVACSSYRALLGEARPERRLAIRFLTPTTFRSAGKRNVNWPSPSLVFGSLLSRWNEFSPLPMPERLREVAAKDILMARYDIETRVMDFGSYKEIGFVGEVEYECPAEVDEETCQLLSALADFALYSGVGAKTTMGMGQARRKAARDRQGSRRARGRVGAAPSDFTGG
ncbi:MAG: CRISPR-associated endoribonuclease Cas6 [Chloroflexota bacterium]